MILCGEIFLQTKNSLPLQVETLRPAAELARRP